MKYPAIEPMRLTGEEPLLNTQGANISSLLGFWQWAYSDLVGNAERGALAEYFVACALDLQDACRISWDRYDLLTKEGIAIEVKTSGYIQTWEQNVLSKPIFEIGTTLGWDSRKNQYDAVSKRQADVYVFCHHSHADQKTINPLDISQWDFYLLPTSVLDEKLPNQKSASLETLKKIGAKQCPYNELYKTIISLATTEKNSSGERSDE